MIQNEFDLLERQDFMEIIQSQRKLSRQAVLKTGAKEDNQGTLVGVAASL